MSRFEPEAMRPESTGPLGEVAGCGHPCSRSERTAHCGLRSELGWMERRSTKPKVTGSNPVGRAGLIKRFSACQGVSRPMPSASQDSRDPA
jgi:hypothetical protein